MHDLFRKSTRRDAPKPPQPSFLVSYIRYNILTYFTRKTQHIRQLALLAYALEQKAVVEIYVQHKLLT